MFTEKTFIHEVEDKYGLKSELEIYLEFFTDWYHKGTWRLEHLNSKIFKTKNGRLIMRSKCAEYGIKNSRFVKEQEAKGLLGNFGIKKLLK